MLTIIGLYLAVSLFLTVYVIVEQDADVSALKPALGRWLVVLILLPTMTLTVLVVSISAGIEGDGRDMKNVWRDYFEDLVEAWNGR